jgi:LysR family transcriptional regulator, regulator for metE and metH
MPLTLDTRHLRLVAAIAQHGSATRAAGVLHLTQSAVSHQLRELEDRLGAPLFLRVGKRMTLTAAGRCVLETAERVLIELERVEDQIRRINVEGAARLRLCAQCNTGYYWLPPLLKEFHRTYPQVDVQVLAEHTAAPVEALLQGTLDLALLTDPKPDPRLDVRPLFRDEHLLLVSPSHRLAGRRWTEPEELAKEHLILYAPTRGRGFTMRRILDPAQVVPARLSFIQLTEGILEMVKAGLGVTVLQRWSVLPAIREGSVVPLRVTRGGIYRQWSAATLANRSDFPWLGRFLSLLKKDAVPAQRE